jgi:uncharacterized protein (TIGR03083 family)
MQLTPRYGSEPVIVLDGSPAAVCGPFVRQRQRLAARVAAFSDEQWTHPSRCAGWSSRDVIAHLDSTNDFFAFSVAAGLAGEPTEILTTFDPVKTPIELVAMVAELSTGEMLDRFTASTRTLVELLASLDDDAWSVLAESPPGHVSVSAVAHHALWDSWVHERDILLPLGISPDREADEIRACLRYVAAIGPTFAINSGGTERGVLALDVTDPDVSVVVEVGERVIVRDGRGAADLRLTGDAVDLLEALSVRRPLTQPIPPAVDWMLRGLAEAFDGEPG